ncbi:hypothetical protein BC830DRAFT_599817 [Chytriomyces sp. MP71]|nr:hypothetical protein BC830DRAFT_599817 [Chytriomyces sp. MP71]
MVEMLTRKQLYGHPLRDHTHVSLNASATRLAFLSTATPSETRNLFVAPFKSGTAFDVDTAVAVTHDTGVGCLEFAWSAHEDAGPHSPSTSFPDSTCDWVTDTLGKQMCRQRSQTMWSFPCRKMMFRIFMQSTFTRGLRLRFLRMNRPLKASSWMITFVLALLTDLRRMDPSTCSVLNWTCNGLALRGSTLWLDPTLFFHKPPSLSRAHS